MNREEIAAQVREALSAVLGKDAGGLGPELGLFDDLGMDSTSVIELLMSLEDTTSLQIDPDELLPEVFATVGSLTDYVQANYDRHQAATV
jgi:acyl carrier protein